MGEDKETRDSFNREYPAKSPSRITFSKADRIGDYGTFIFPERKTVGAWRLQTDYQPLIEIMKKRGWDKKSPWRTIGWGTSYIFKRDFSGTYEAKRSFERILKKTGVNDAVLIRLFLGGFEAVLMPSYQHDSENAISELISRKPPPLTGKNQGPHSNQSTQFHKQLENLNKEIHHNEY